MTIGNFDGVHRGHQALLSQARQIADRMGLPLALMLFEPQPAEFLNPQGAPARIASLREKLFYLGHRPSQGDGLTGVGSAAAARGQVDYVYCLHFNRHLANMNARQFAENIVFDSLNCQHLIIGADFRFGCQRSGDLSLLQQIAREKGREVHVFPDFNLGQARVSSTLIRRFLAAGKITEAEDMLGHPYVMIGRVIRGDGRGRQWGIPTANIHLARPSLALAGVFCVSVSIDGADKTYPGVANVGCRPTVDGQRNILEVHLLDTHMDLYGQILKVRFLQKLRPETKFNTIDELLTQIHLDIKQARAFFNPG